MDIVQYIKTVRYYGQHLLYFLYVTGDVDDGHFGVVVITDKL